jgi:hypothetical protein
MSSLPLSIEKRHLLTFNKVPAKSNELNSISKFIFIFYGKATKFSVYWPLASTAAPTAGQIISTAAPSLSGKRNY